MIKVQNHVHHPGAKRWEEEQEDCQLSLQPPTRPRTNVTAKQQTKDVDRISQNSDTHSKRKVDPKDAVKTHGDSNRHQGHSKHHHGHSKHHHAHRHNGRDNRGNKDYHHRRHKPRGPNQHRFPEDEIEYPQEDRVRDAIDPGMKELQPPSNHHEDMVCASAITNEDLRDELRQIVHEEYRHTPVVNAEELPAFQANQDSRQDQIQQGLDDNLDAESSLEGSSSSESSYEYIVTLPPGSVGLKFKKNSWPPVIGGFKETCQITHKVKVGDRVTAFILPDGTLVEEFDIHELQHRLKDYATSSKRKLVISSAAAPNERRSPQGSNIAAINHGHSKNHQTRIPEDREGASEPKVDRCVVKSVTNIMPNGSQIEEIEYSDGTRAKKTVTTNRLSTPPLAQTMGRGNEGDEPKYSQGGPNILRVQLYSDDPNAVLIFKHPDALTKGTARHQANSAPFAQSYGVSKTTAVTYGEQQMVNVKLTPALPFKFYSNMSLYNFTQRAVDSATDDVVLMSMEGFEEYQKLQECDCTQCLLCVLLCPVMCCMVMGGGDPNDLDDCCGDPDPIAFAKKRIKMEGIHSKFQFQEEF